MANNTFQHISNEAKYVAFDPTGTTFPTTVKTVQDALAITSPTSQATETKIGVAKVATQAQVTAGTDDTTFITPKKLAVRLQQPDATTAVKGIVYLATNAEALAGTISTNKAINPANLKYVIDDAFTNKKATESAQGVIKLSTLAAAQAGSDDTTAMTPLKVKQAIAAAIGLIPDVSVANETTQGIVKLATVGEVQQGTLRSGVAVSPYSLAQLTGNTTRKGIAKAATQAEANAGTLDDAYISASGFKNYVATTINVGTVKLTNVVGTAGPGLALSATANVLSTAGGTVSGNLNVTGALTQAGANVINDNSVNDHMPIGSVIMWAGPNLPAGGKWEFCAGIAKSKTAFPKLFAVIGYTYGGSGDTFYTPDLQGLFVRGAGTGKHILNERGVDSKGKPKLGVGVDGGSLGEVQKQQLVKHKHVTPFGEAYTGGSRWPWGRSVYRNNFGSNGGEDWDNFYPFTNDGSEFDPTAIRTEYTTVNPEGLMGPENRPWNMSLHYIIKVA